MYYCSGWCYLRTNFLLVTSYQLLVTSHQLPVTSYQLLVTSYQSLVTGHQLLVTSYQLIVTSYQSLVTSYQSLVTFSAAPLIVQKQPFKVVLHKIVQRNFINFTAKHLYRTHLPDTLFSTKLQVISLQLDKKDSDNDMFR